MKREFFITLPNPKDYIKYKDGKLIFAGTYLKIALNYCKRKRLSFQAFVHKKFIPALYKVKKTQKLVVIK